ncbi:MAG TPA: biopolymer transporter ExbD [Burkholderiales bacterium]|nr:biopolymer transporter ExbD [Burkholderiales bacterium]
MSARVRRPRRHPAGLDITAFMNMIVVLVPFLLTTAVFSRLAVLELTLPTQSSGFENLKGDLQLEIVIRRDALEVGDRIGGLLRRVENTGAGHDYQTLSSLMQQLKARYPDKVSATILAEPDTSYDTLVHTMDAVRGARAAQGRGGPVELFPEISVGDAPSAGRTR